jgi:hypothetical protein
MMSIVPLQVRNVVIHSCPDLLLSLDLRGVNPTDVPFTIRSGRGRVGYSCREEGCGGKG